MPCRARDSKLGDGGTRGGGGEAGSENLTTVDAGSKDLEVVVAPASRDVNGLLRTGVSDVGASVGGDAGARTGMGSVAEV